MKSTRCIIYIQDADSHYEISGATETVGADQTLRLLYLRDWSFISVGWRVVAPTALPWSDLLFLVPTLHILRFFSESPVSFSLVY